MHREGKTILTQKTKYETCKNYSANRSVIVPWRECWRPAKDLEVAFDFIQEGCDKSCDHIQYLYRFKNGFGVSLAANQSTRTYRMNFGLMEAVVIYFPDKNSNHFEFVCRNIPFEDEEAYDYIRGEGMEEVKLDLNITKEYNQLWGYHQMYSIRSMFQDKFQRGLKGVRSL